MLAADAVLQADDQRAIAQCGFDLLRGRFEIVELGGQEDNVGVGDGGQVADDGDGGGLFFGGLADMVEGEAVGGDGFGGRPAGKQVGVGVVPGCPGCEWSRRWRRRRR